MGHTQDGRSKFEPEHDVLIDQSREMAMSQLKNIMELIAT